MTNTLGPLAVGVGGVDELVTSKREPPPLSSSADFHETCEPSGMNPVLPSGAVH